MNGEDLNDPIRLRHMLQFARQARRISLELTLQRFIEDIVLQLAIDKLIQNIGEAANHVTPGVRQANAHILWRVIINMRHILVHRYYRANPVILWKTATENVPVLIADLERLLADDRA